MLLRFLALLLLIASCNDRTRTIPPVTFEPRADDMGLDAQGDIGPPPMPDGICDGQLDGASCELPQSRGVCANQTCVLIACESGFGDCDDSPGCETALDDPASCGGCDVACGPEEGCLRGPGGYACAAGILCPTDRYDLDSDSSNGCEWQAEWEDPYALAPVGLEIETVGWGDAPLLAGGDGDSRVSVALGVAPQVTVWPEPRGDARAIHIQVDASNQRVVWSDGVSLQVLSNLDTYFLTPPCEPAAVPRAFVGATPRFVATQFEVLEVDVGCSGGPCLAPLIGVADYHDALFGDFEPEELTQCDGCATMLAEECWGLEQCRDELFDPMVCAGCDPSGCPSFEIVDIVELGTQLAIVTARGVLLYDTVTGVLRSSEELFDPMVAGGARFVRGTDAPGDLTVFHSTGFLRVLDDRLAAQLPDLGVAFDPEAASIAGQGDAIVAVSNDDARLIVPAAQSGRSVFLDMTSAPGIQGLRPVAATSTPEGLRVFYQAAGQLFTRRLFQQ